MAVSKDFTIRRIDGSYVKMTGINFDVGGMTNISGSLWKNAADRIANPSNPLIGKYAFSITDATTKAAVDTKIMAFIYSLIEEFPDLAGGTAIYDTESVSLDQTEVSLAVGASATLVVTVLPTTATDKSVAWSSSDTAIATVADGVVTAVAAGSSTITVKTVDRSKTATCKVTVTA
jgi:uncharacterized protein YjdB